MNKKFNNKKLLPVIGVIAAIALMPILSTQGFAQVTDANVTTIDPRDFTSDVLPTDVLETYPEVQFRGGTEGWALVGGYAFPSEIGLHGTAVRGDDGVWHLKAEGELLVGEREATLVLRGAAHDGHLRLHGTGTLGEDGPEFRIVLRGNYAPTTVEGDYALTFNHSFVSFADSDVRIPLMQVGKVHVEPVTPDAVTDEIITDRIVTDQI